MEPLFPDFSQCVLKSDPPIESEDLMSKMILPIASALFVFLTGELGFAEEPAKKETVTLMGMLHEWIYPESKFQGAQVSDAAMTDVSAIKSKAVLTTPDPFEKVLGHYLKKLNVDADGKNLNEKPGERTTTERSVLVQDISKELPSQETHRKLVVINVNGPRSSMTLVLSRCDHDEVTQIAWSNFRQLSP